MITPEDIQLIIAAEKENFPSKADFEELLKEVRDSHTSTDNYSKKTAYRSGLLL